MNKLFTFTSRRITIFLFIFLVIIVFITQYDLLKYTLEIGFVPDDWSFTLYYKTHVNNPIINFPEVWKERGAYTTHAIYYIGVLHSLVGLNFQSFQLIGITLKILATLTIFPLVIIVFGNRFLAFLTTVLFAISYTTTGQLEVVVEQSEYLGLLLMNLFLIVYSYIVKNELSSWKWLGLATMMLMITIMLSTIRTFPILILLPLIEFSLWVQYRSLKSLKLALIRLLILFSPFIILILYQSASVLGMANFPPTPIVKIIQGNWHLILVPLQGLGHMLSITNYLGKLLGDLKMESMLEYLTFILTGPTIFFGSITLILSLIKLKHQLKFFYLTFGLNFLLGILVYFVAIHRLSIPVDLRLNFDNPRIYLTILGLYILVLSFVYFLEWRTQKIKDSLIFAIWVGPVASLVFILMTWMYADLSLGFSGPQDHYLMIPTFGVSLFLAGLLILIYNKIKNIKYSWFRSILATFTFGFITSLYFTNRELIHEYFIAANTNGRSAAGQQIIQSKFRQKINQVDFSKSNLFYFDTSEIREDGRFFTESFLSSFPFWMRFQGTQLIDGCSERLYLNEHTQLIPYIKEQDGQKGFFYKGLCVENGKGDYKDIFYTPENFYAFKLKNRDFIDIKEGLLKELGF